jgi:molecular chaperone DnaJ
LGVEATATERDIKTSYRKLALKYHPDKNKEPGAEDMFKTITSAYAVLVNKESRDKYDRTRPINAQRR